MAKKTSKNAKTPLQQEMFDVPQINDANYSVKSDALATALLGEHIKPVYKRCFEGVLTKIKRVDIESFIVDDKPLRVRLSPREYNMMFPRFRGGTEKNFRAAAAYYSKNTTLDLPDPDNPDDPESIEHVNVVDSAKVLSSGEFEILFTRSILPHLSDVKRRLLAIDVSQFGRLTSKYSQKMYETFAAWNLDRDLVSHRVSIAYLRAVLSIPKSYSDYKVRTGIIDPAMEEINEKTNMNVSYTGEKGESGKGIKYLAFVITISNETEENDTEGQRALFDENNPVNEFVEEGITDKQFESIVNARKATGKPANQSAVNAYVQRMVDLSKDPQTVSLDEIIGMFLAQGWKGWPEKKWVLNPNASTKDNPVPGQQPVKKTEPKKPSQPKQEAGVPPVDPNQFFENARQQVKTGKPVELDWPDGVRETIEEQVKGKG